jgi:hypothetical protein
MQLWVNWRTKITHLSRDCHQIVRVPNETPWLELIDDDIEELMKTGRRYCGWCVGRLLRATDREGIVPDADLHPPAERADYLTKAEKERREAREAAQSTA